jgi:hypothetical protein
MFFSFSFLCEAGLLVFEVAAALIYAHNGNALRRGL